MTVKVWLKETKAKIGSLALALWALAIVLVLVTMLLFIRSLMPQKTQTIQANASIPETQLETSTDVLPPSFSLSDELVFPINRQADANTIIPSRSSGRVVSYEVQPGDSLFGIAASNSITPETLLWANYDVLNDNPDEIVPGMVLNIPPVNGVYYQWQSGDTFDSVAKAYETEADKIINWFGNDIDLINPSVAVGEWLMLVDGQREFRSWVIPIIPRGAAGVSSIAYGPGGCTGPFEGAYGTGSFVWPTSIHNLVGNDFWSGHLAIDLATDVGFGIMAADSGVVTFAGWANGGYGYTVMIDHGNGYSTLYAHLSSVTTYCGASVSKGQTIGVGGSTGNSTGPHLHFEVRYLGGFLNPWTILP